MRRPRRKKDSVSPGDALVVSRRKPVPHAFVLDAIESLSPEIRPMFGCTAVYVADKIMLILRDRLDVTADNGVWLATTARHHESLGREFPCLRSLKEFGKRVTGWQVLPAEHRRRIGQIRSRPRVLRVERIVWAGIVEGHLDIQGVVRMVGHVGVGGGEPSIC